MPVNSRDLINSAQLSHSNSTCEADWRGVCSRAYYSIYQDGKDFHDSLPSPGSLTPDSDGGMHADLIDRLIHPTVPRTSTNYLRSTSIGYMMKTVYANRIKSDYKRDKIIDKAAADNSIELMNKIFAKLNEAPDLRQMEKSGAVEAMQVATKNSAPPQSQDGRGRPTIIRIK